MSASFTIAGRNNGFTTAETRAATHTSVRAYREAMAEFAQMGTMDIWYARLSETELLAAVKNLARTGSAKGRKQAKKTHRNARAIAAKARTRDSLQALSKLAELVDGAYRIVSQPPIVIPMRDLPATAEMSPDHVMEVIQKQFRSYRATLQSDRRHLLERFEIIDVARKVVGVGSVGTRAFIVLLQGRDQRDPLFLQVKEATASVLEDHRYLYWRQLRDMKGSVVVESMPPRNLEFYAHACGWTLARAHARSGDPIAIAGYLGKGDGFDRSITDFSERYADQNEQDYRAFVEAVRSGRLEAIEGV
jgi:uncharacterized protein (DUF2252 family)